MVHWPHRFITVKSYPRQTQLHTYYILPWYNWGSIQETDMCLHYMYCKPLWSDNVLFTPHLFTKQLIHSRAGSLRSWTGWLWWWRWTRCWWPFRLSTISGQHPSPPRVLVICTKAIMSLLQEEDWLHPQQFTNHEKVFIDHFIKQSI